MRSGTQKPATMQSDQKERRHVPVSDIFLALFETERLAITYDRHVDLRSVERVTPGNATDVERVLGIPARTLWAWMLR
eukprot:2726670-Rhodomonas_salina.1